MGHASEAEATPRISGSRDRDPEAQAQGIREGAAQAADGAVLAARLGQADRRAHHRRVRGPRRCRQGRHDHGNDGASEPAHLPACRASGTVRPGENADVCPALSRAFSGGRRDRDLRPELVQPRRRGIRHGLLHQGAAQALPGDLPRHSKSRSSTTASGSSSTGSKSATRNRSSASKPVSTIACASGS